MRWHSLSLLPGWLCSQTTLVSICLRPSPPRSICQNGVRHASDSLGEMSTVERERTKGAGRTIRPQYRSDPNWRRAGRKEVNERAKDCSAVLRKFDKVSERSLSQIAHWVPWLPEWACLAIPATFRHWLEAASTLEVWPSHAHLVDQASRLPTKLRKAHFHGCVTTY